VPINSYVGPRTDSEEELAHLESLIRQDRTDRVRQGAEQGWRCRQTYSRPSDDRTSRVPSSECYQHLDSRPEIRAKIALREMSGAEMPAQGSCPCLREITTIKSSHASRAERSLVAGARLDNRKTNEHS